MPLPLDCSHNLEHERCFAEDFFHSSATGNLTRADEKQSSAIESGHDPCGRIGSVCNIAKIEYSVGLA